MTNTANMSVRRLGLAFACLSACVCAGAFAANGTVQAAKNPAPAAIQVPVSPYEPDRFAGRAGRYYLMLWGIDTLSVRLAESGELVRFSYRVLNPAKAGPLNDKRLEPALIDPKAGVSLVVPTMEKVGQLRQTAPASAGQTYWMTFSNKGGKVRRGDRVDIAIGTFRAHNLVVD